MAVAALVLLGSCLAPQAKTGTAPARIAPGPGIHDMEREMFKRLNADRKERGLYPLIYDERLADVARGHSEDMREHRFFEHESPTKGTPDDRMIAAKIFFRTARENLADAFDVQSAEDGLLKSPKHYANITATDVTHVGIGIVEGGIVDPDNLLITQDFTLPVMPESVEAARAHIVRAVDEARKKQGLPPLAPGGPLNALAAEEIRGLPVSPGSDGLEEAGKSIRKNLRAKHVRIKSLSLESQLLSQSDAFKVPPSLLEQEPRQYGLALRKVAGEKAEPLLLMLIVVGS